MELEGGGEGGNEDGVNGTGAGDVLQGNSEVGVFIWEKELGGDKGNDKITRGIPLSVSQKNCADDGTAYNKRRVGVALCG